MTSRLSRSDSPKVRRQLDMRANLYRCRSTNNSDISMTKWAMGMSRLSLLIILMAKCRHIPIRAPLCAVRLPLLLPPPRRLYCRKILCVWRCCKAIWPTLCPDNTYG
ncbi:uncharacterized protein PV09_09389 [Verruconis gallopava]|uniref:Uncharacterized protein n=1 Tax=Verruconis gallopava TaxID=253628 RepID=A0A0D2AIU6_9PEZI|nr:uncharacterized protein PV09_09389 [Verruconis gallopava]KIV98863.1 hypothetical protein PV09_09389 [Verruconis gallopava]